MKAIYLSLAWVLLTVFSPAISAQTEANFFQPDKAFTPRWGLHLMPLSNLNPNPRLRIGIQRQWARISVVTDFSYGADWTPILWSDTWEIDEGYRFMAIRPEIRYHLESIKDVVDAESMLYIGLEGYFTYLERIRIDDYFFIDDRQFVFDEAKLQRARHGVMAKFGMNASIGKHLYFDSYIGLGIALRQIRYVDTVNLFSVDQVDNGTGFEEWFIGDGLWRTYGNRWLPDLALGLRIGIFL